MTTPTANRRSGLARFVAMTGLALTGPCLASAPDAPAPVPQSDPAVQVESTATPTARPSSTIDPAAPQSSGLADPRHTSWVVEIDPRFWYLSPSGDLRLPARSGTGGPTGGGFPNSGDKVDISTLNLDSPQFEPAGEMHISADRFRFTFSGGTYSIHRDQTTAESAFRIGASTVAGGDSLDVKFEFSTYELSLGYCVWARDFAASTAESRREQATPLELRTCVFAGVRMYETDIGVTNLTASTSADATEFFFEPILGGRAELEINRIFSIDLQLSGGYYADSDRSASSIDVAASFTYRPFTNVGVQIGWRQLAFDLSDGDGLDEFEYSGRLAGLFAGVSIRF
jgi:hypothetical protein